MYNVKELQERKNELQKQMESMTEQVRSEDRAFTDEELNQWDSVEAELQDVDKQLETAERMARLPQREKKSSYGVVTSERNYNGKTNSKPTVEECGDAVRAWFIKSGSVPVSERHAEKCYKAAEKCNFRLGGKAFSFKMRSDIDELKLKLRTQSTTDSEGGYSINNGIISAFEDAKKWYWNWSDAVTVNRVSNGASTTIVNSNNTDRMAAYVDEGSAVTNTNATFSTDTINFHKLVSATFPITNELIQDSELDILSYIGQICGESVWRKIGYEVSVGATSGKVSGFASNSTQGLLSTYYDGFHLDDIVDLMESVDQAYRKSPKCGFMMHSSVHAELIKTGIVAGGGLFGLGLNGAPQMQLLGFPIYLNNHLPAFSTFASGVKQMWFGDFSKVQVSIARDVEVKTSEELYWKEDCLAVKASARFTSYLLDAGTNPIKHLTSNTDSGAPSING
ncbi:MAG: phage major capsid protein [Planctomycetaceae bacterium]|nr:phage major capsid protein [Planctomycetaceae bacterium]